MGVVNITPDSFSDGGQFLDPQKAVDHALRLEDEGADVLDFGAESTRPGALPVTRDEQLLRLTPVLEKLDGRLSATISIDTTDPLVFQACHALGARMWNDVDALRGELALEVAAVLKSDVILMHRPAPSLVMQGQATYEDVVAEVEAFLRDRARCAIAAGIMADRIWLDPGIGFGKRLDHNLALINAVPRLSALGFKCVIGASNKRLIGDLEVRKGAKPSPADERLGGTIALHLKAARDGASMVRVHNVRAMHQALIVDQALNL